MSFRMELKTMTVKINSRVFKKRAKIKNITKFDKYLDDQWQNILLPLIQDISEEKDIVMPVEYYHK